MVQVMCKLQQFANCLESESFRKNSKSCKLLGWRAAARVARELISDASLPTLDEMKDTRYTVRVEPGCVGLCAQNLPLNHRYSFPLPARLE